MCDMQYFLRLPGENREILKDFHFTSRIQPSCVGFLLGLYPACLAKAPCLLHLAQLRQRAQYPFVKAYNLNRTGVPNMI